MRKAETPGDETGARAERLEFIRNTAAIQVPLRGRADLEGWRQDVRILLAEIDRLTVQSMNYQQKAKSVQHGFEDAYAKMMEARAERDTAIASRNAWAEKCAGLEAELDRVGPSRFDAEVSVARLRETLAWMRQTIHQAHGHDGEIAQCHRNTCHAASEALAATEPGL